MSEPICIFNNLTLQWGSEPLWSELSVSLPPGLTALVGPNGHGKSALLGVLAGRFTPNQGQVTWSVPLYYQTQLDPLTGPRVADALGVGVLFDAFSRLEQGEADPNDLERVADHWHRPAEWAKQLVDAGLEPDLALPVEALSGGQRTRLALCRALMHTGHYLLLDEPDNHLDLDSKTLLEQALQDYEGTLVIVTHDDAFAGALALGGELRLGSLVG